LLSLQLSVQSDLYNTKLPVTDLLNTDYFKIISQKLYRYIFWTGYFLVLITSFVNITGSFNDIKLGRASFRIRLDHLLHFSAYLLICLYYVFGQRKGLLLFNSNSLMKFILIVILLATVTEVVQLWVPTRTFNPIDWVANVAGLATGVGVIGMMQRLKTLPRSNGGVKV
jgi:VanZ family protein